jgi:hypothetical protein
MREIHACALGIIPPEILLLYKVLLQMTNYEFKTGNANYFSDKCKDAYGSPKHHHRWDG